MGGVVEFFRNFPFLIFGRRRILEVEIDNGLRMQPMCHLKRD